MARKKKNKKPADPKPRHIWEINPKTRVNESDKAYNRPEEKKKEKSWVNDVSWFGEVKKKPSSPFDFLPAKETVKNIFPVEGKTPSLPLTPSKEKAPSFDFPEDDFSDENQEAKQKEPKRKLSRSEREALDDDDFGLDDF